MTSTPTFHAVLNIVLYAFLVANGLWYSRTCLGRRPTWATLRRLAVEFWAEDEVERHVQVFLERRRLQRARIGLKSLGNCSFIGALLLAALGLEGIPIGSACYLGGVSAIFVCQLFRQKITFGGVRMLYSWVMLMHIMTCLPDMLWLEEDHRLSSTIVRLLSRLCCGVWVMDLKLSILWNVLYSVALCVCHVLGPHGFNDSSKLTSEAEEGVFRELLVLGVLVSIFRDCLMLFKTEALRNAESQAFQNEGSAKTSLLKAMCDVVVVLDAELKIAEACPQLTHMLRTQRNLTGDMLHHHMPSEEDQKRFDQFMAAAMPMEEDLAELLNVRLRDRFGVDRQVELLRARFQKLDNSVGHLVGIRIQVEGSAAADQQALTAPLSPGVEDSSSVQQEAARPETSETSFDKIISEDRLTLSFDALGGTILDHSLQFGVLFGKLLVGSSVQEAISSVSEFWSWVQQCAMTLFYGERGLPACPVAHLRMRGGRFPSGLRLPIREIKIFRLPNKSLIEGNVGSSAVVVISILFLTLRTKPLLRLAAAKRESCFQRLSIDAGASALEDDAEMDELDTSGSGLTSLTVPSSESLFAPVAREHTDTSEEVSDHRILQAESSSEVFEGCTDDGQIEHLPREHVHRSPGHFRNARQGKRVWQV